MKMKSNVAAMSLMLVLGTAAAPAHALYCPPFNETLVIGKMTVVEGALKALWKTLFDTLSKTLLSYDRQELSAMRVAASQMATSAKAEINAGQAVMSGRMAAIGSLAQTQLQLQVFQRFSPVSGQGVDPCAQLGAQNVFAQAGRSATNAVSSIVSQAAAAPGRYGGAENYMDRLLKMRQSLFATPEEEKLGLGRANNAVVTTTTGAKFALAGADTNAGVLFADVADPRVKAAKDAFINHMGGIPDAPIPKDIAMLPAGKDLLMRKNEKDAGMSAALSSLAMIAAQTTPDKQGPSRTQARREMVGQYFGNSASERWKGWTTQNERGLLVDQLKMDATQLALMQEQYEAGQREEVLLAATLLREAKQRFRPALDSAYQAIDLQRNRPGVR